MPPTSSGETPTIQSGEVDRARETREKGTDSISLQHCHHHLPLASTASSADDAVAASALSATLLPLLPPASAAWAYGSGVFSQQQRDLNSQSSPRPSVDLLLAVRDPRGWHAENLDRNPTHYSSLARSRVLLGGSAGICWLAENVGPGVWFNSGVRVEERGGGGGGEEGSEEGGTLPPTPPTTLKYGVFSENALLSDLETWGELYLAGRLQKPTLRLPLETTKGTENSFASRLEAALERNTAAALAAALLLLPPTFSHSRLLSTLVSLSYSGDVRVAAAAEDPLKVDKIVRGTGRRRLDGLYSRHLPFPFSSPSLSSPSSLSSSSSSSSCSSSQSPSSPVPVAAAAGLIPLCGGEAWAQDPRGENRRELVGLLPERVRRRVEVVKEGASSSSLSPFSSSSSPSLLASSVRVALASTVRSSSARAAFVGLVSAGPAGAVSV